MAISKRRDRWVLDFYDQNGKRRWKTMPKGATKKQAREQLREIEAQIDRGSYLPEAKALTFKQVADKWLSHKQNNIRQSTWNCYAGHIRNHFKTVRQLRINCITVATVEKFFTERRATGMTLATLKKVRVTFGQVMAYAVRHRYIDYNPVRDAEMPKDTGRIRKKKIRVLSAGEILAFLGAVTNVKYRLLFKLAFATGARQGELLGLKWTDILWSANQINIQRTYNNGAWYRPKTASSERKIDIGPMIARELKAWKLRCPPNELDLVFPNEAGNVIDDTTMIRTHFLPTIKKAGLKRFRFHDMRHTYASHLIDQGENIKYIQTQLGHSSPSITLDVYSHLLKPSNHQAAKRLEVAIFKNGSSLVAGGGLTNEKRV